MLKSEVRDELDWIDSEWIIVDTFAANLKQHQHRVYRNSIDFKLSHLRPAYLGSDTLQEKNQLTREIFGFYVNNKEL